MVGEDAADGLTCEVLPLLRRKTEEFEGARKSRTKNFTFSPRRPLRMSSCAHWSRSRRRGRANFWWILLLPPVPAQIVDESDLSPAPRLILHDLGDPGGVRRATWFFEGPPSFLPIRGRLRAIRAGVARPLLRHARYRTSSFPSHDTTPNASALSPPKSDQRAPSNRAFHCD